MSDEQTTEHDEQSEVTAAEEETTEDNEPGDELTPDDETGTAEYWKKRSRQNEKSARQTQRRLKEVEAEIERLRNGDGDEAAQKATEAEKAAIAKANTKILRAEVKAAAAGKLANPALAVKLLDLSKFEVDDDGEVDQTELAEAIDELLRDEPYLAAEKPKRFQGGADQGARKKPKPASLDERIAEAERNQNWAEARRLKSSKLTQSAS